MKKTHILLFVAAVLTFTCVACHKKATPQPAGSAALKARAEADPIMPVHLNPDTTDIYLTDYIPALTDYQKILIDGKEVKAENGIVRYIANPDEMVQLHKIQFVSNNDILTVIMLPYADYENGLVTIGADEKSVKIDITHDAENGKLAILWQNILIENPKMESAEDGSIRIFIPDNLHKDGRSYLRIFATDSKTRYNDLLIPLQDMKPVLNAAELNRHDDHAQVLYSLMIDRFENGNPANDQKLNSKEVLDIVDYQGGDIAGITKKIREGWFNELGITTIWVSPITQNPRDAWGYYPFPKDKPAKYKDIDGEQPAYTKFSGYHGYWPIYVTQLDDRFGTDAELKEMLQVAHEHGLNVILDYVANHMHIASPTLQEHPTWITDSIITLPDGTTKRNFELWDEARLTTWFDVHIPSLDLEKDYVCEPMTDSALYWLATYDFDGFRHDACKHIPLNYWRMFGEKIAQRFPDRHIWMIGETYGDADLISSYVKSGMLNSQFNFNIYHTAIDVFGRDRSMRDLANVIEETQAVYGSHHTMGNISGNHDKARFISLCGGALSWDENDKLAGWTREVGIAKNNNPKAIENAYKRAMLLEVINLTLPGVPCIYQGDEYGQYGANDPDNRNMMRFNGLSEREQAFRAEMEQLIQLRRQNMELIYGEYIPLFVDDDCLAFARVYMGNTITVKINKSAEPKTILGEEIPAYGYKLSIL